MILVHSEHTFKNNIYAYFRVELWSTMSITWGPREKCLFDTVITHLGRK